MNINLLFIGLNTDNAPANLQRAESLLSNVSESAKICILQKDSEEAIPLIKEWAAGHPISNELFDEADFTLFTGPSAAETAKRFAAAKQLSCYPEVIGIEVKDGNLRAVRKVYSTHLNAYYPVYKAVLVSSQTGPKKEYSITAAAEDVVINSFDWEANPTGEGTIISKTKIEKGEDLSTAKIVLLGGKGLGNKENFHRLERLAAKLGASCGCTRPVAMAGWTTYDKVVGLSGATLQADLCIAFGVSGAGPLMQGAKGAARLVAVNNDPKAPIFSGASEGIVADCIEILEAMEKEV